MNNRVYKQFFYVIFTIFISTLFLSGCAHQMQKVSVDEYSGFLGDYSKLTPSSAGKGMRWISEDIKQYSKVTIDPVVLYPLQQPGGAERIILLNRIKSYLGDGIVKAIADKNIEIVNQPGEGVARIRPAITGISSETEGLKAYQFIPVALLFQGAKAAAGKRDVAVRVFLEAEVVDSTNGKVLAQVVRKGTGQQMNAEEPMFDDIKPVLDNWIDEGATNIAALLAK
mgnify:CR=1 FL=1